MDFAQLISASQCIDSLSKMDLVGWLAVGFNPIVTQGTWDVRWNPSVGVFLRDLNPYHASFGENHRKLRTTRAGRQAFRELNPIPSVYQFESRIARPLVG